MNSTADRRYNNCKNCQKIIPICQEFCRGCEERLGIKNKVEDFKFRSEDEDEN